MLTEDHKRQRIETSREFLSRYAEQGEVFSDSIVTGDETWVYHFTSESKQQSLEWRHSRSPKKRKFKVTQSARKIMATFFWDRKGVLLIEFMPTGTTINAASYCEILKKLHRAIQNRRRGMLTKGVCLLHDNARPHVARDTKALLEKFGWDVISHPPYSPDLAPSDYHLFLNSKKHLGGKRLS
jgi:histone-lysine N-methyltransferase SETMAR